MNTQKGKVITISSVKGGVGKTTMTANLAGIYFLMKKRVLIVDLDLYSGGIATILNVDNKRDIYMLVDSISNNRFTSLSEYVSTYNNGIDVLATPKDPRNVSKIESKYITKILDIARREYDVILVDTYQMLDELNLVVLDNCDKSAFMVTNDLVDLKNMKSLISIFNEAGKDNYLVVLNNSRDTGRDYISLFDVRNILKRNIDYTISKNFYIKNIDKYVLKGEILTLNKFINSMYSSDIKNMNKLAIELIRDDDEVNGNG